MLGLIKRLKRWSWLMQFGVGNVALSLNQLRCLSFIRSRLLPDIHDLLGKLSEDDEASDADPANSTSRRQIAQEGITTLDIAELPEPQKTIMFAILRDKTSSGDGITLEQLEDQFDIENLVDILMELADQNWLTISNNTPQRFKPNLRRSRKRLSDDLWSAISRD